MQSGFVCNLTVYSVSAWKNALRLHKVRQTYSEKFDTVLTFVLIGILLVFGVVRNLPPFDFLRPYG